MFEYFQSLLNQTSRYLRSPNRHIFLQPQKAQLTASLSCVLYLQSSLDFVDSRVTEEAKRSSVLLCLHDLNLYAIDHWLDHLLALSKSMGSYPDRCELEPLLRSLDRLTVMHQSIAALQGSDLHAEQEQAYRQQGQDWHLFGMSQAAQSLLDRVLVHQQTASSVDYPEPRCMAALQDSSSLVPVPPAIDRNANHQYPLLFSHIRERYQSIVEELVETEEANNQILSAFILRQASGAFLCRYRGCSRAAQGFHSSVLREKHEESHRPRFQCAHATCGLFGTTFNSRAAMKKHTARYHDEDNTASVPNSLTRKPRGLHEDRTLFAFSDAKTKWKAEEFTILPEFYEPVQTSLKDQTALTSSDSRHSASAGTTENSKPSTNAEFNRRLSAYLTNHVAMRSALDQTGHVDGVMSDIHQDESNDPGLAATPSSQHRQQGQGDTVSPHKPTFSDLLQVANTGHLTARSASPAVIISRQRSPFNESSQFAVEGAYSSPSSPAGVTRLTSAAQLRQQQKIKADAHAYAQHHPPSPPPGLTISPNEMFLDVAWDLHNIEEDTGVPLTDGYPSPTPLISTNNPDSSSFSKPQFWDPTI